MGAGEGGIGGGEARKGERLGRGEQEGGRRRGYGWEGEWYGNGEGEEGGWLGRVGHLQSVEQDANTQEEKEAAPLRLRV